METGLWVLKQINTLLCLQVKCCSMVLVLEKHRVKSIALVISCLREVQC